ncbi:MAG: arginyltransferase [Candidatus Riflebacteria bacterium]|nr:arginyltransferase [Candidatus Riflebacteria bacterium]
MATLTIVEKQSAILLDATPCELGPDRLSRTECQLAELVEPAECELLLEQGWRRLGPIFFRHSCPDCCGCRSLRVIVDRFRPDRSQRRAARACERIVRLVIGRPELSLEKVRLYDAFHAFRTRTRGWAAEGGGNVEQYLRSFILNPLPTQEWRYFIGGRLAAVGYVDALPRSLNAIQFFHDPDDRGLSLGTFNVLSLLDVAASRGLGHVYLGYHLASSPSLAYKAAFVPNQLYHEDGAWRDFRSRRE